MGSPSRPGTTFKTASKRPLLRSNPQWGIRVAGRGAEAVLAGDSPTPKIRGNFRTMPEAVRYFGEKANLPSATWRDLWQGQHARAFTVAGAMKADLLGDLRQAVDGAIRDGESLGKFRQRFDDIVARHGWAHTGSRNWRTKVIYDTNVRTSFMAGKYAKLTDPDMLARHPYWEYRHYTRDNPRLEHKAWNGLILRHDDPWWQVHFPPNGWGCHCDVLPASAR
ncbi:MAG TPA: phage minor head protein, partial [Tahibacter sp.]|nr:phage minor head protein [Tahibacter sp.]